MNYSRLHVAVATAERNSGVDLADLVTDRTLREHRDALIRQLDADGFSRQAITRHLHISWRSIHQVLGPA